METSFPATLELISLEFGGNFSSDQKGVINLTKGIQKYGQINFKVNQGQNKYVFTQNNIINFSYTLRLTTRRDFFFHINLNTNNLNSDQSIGDFIGISCHMLAETFQNDQNALIYKSDCFARGVILKYKIYQPQIGIKDKNIICFKNVQKNDLISKIFSASEIPEEDLLGSKMKKSRADKSSHSKKSNQNDKSNANAHQKESRNEIGQDLKKSQIRQFEKEQFLSRIFRYVRQSGFIDKKKKYEFSSKQTHHDNHGLSKKLKAVIILLIMGMLFLLVDTIADRLEKSSDLKSNQKSKNKLIKKNKIDHF